VNDSSGAGRSLALPLTVVPPPAITSIAPASATAGSPGFTLTVSGGNCPAGCVVQWNGSPLATTHSSDTTVTASVPGNLIAAAGTANVQLVNQYGSASNTAIFTINPAATFLTGLSPSSVTAGSTAFPLTVSGTGFVNGSMVLWNGATLATSYTSGTQLTVFVTADLVSLRAGVSASVTVVNPGGAASNSVTMAIDPPRPTILSLSPASAAAGSTSVAILLTGSNFAANCVVRWNGTAVETTFTDAGHVSATVPANLLVVAGAYPITVTNPSGLVASPMTFTVIPSTPAASSVTPASVTEGAPAFTLTVNGAYFAPASTVLWNGAPQGVLDHAVASGAESPADPLALPLAAVAAKLGGKPAEVAFAGLAPGFVGLLQVNLLVPDIPGGEQALEVTVGDVAANVTVVSVAENR
jgi:trimeric autotransporter adhesin